MILSKEEVVKELRGLGVSPRKSRGQNFLIDPAGVEAIVDFARPVPGVQMVEIGPGLGALTIELMPIGPLTVIELEQEFCKRLRRLYPALDVLQEDVRSVDFSQIGSSLVVFGNLPYSLSTEILFHLFAFSKEITRAVLLLQKEFVARLAAGPGSKTFGALSLARDLLADARTGPVLSGKSFFPSAEVDSQVIELRFLDQPRFDVYDRFLFTRAVQAAFFKRRRKIANSFAASRIFPSIEMGPIFAAAGIDPEVRAESLPLERFVALANALTSTGS